MNEDGSPLLARRGGCGEAADGVVDHKCPVKLSRTTWEFILRLIHHPGASRHPSWPGGAIVLIEVLVI